MSRQALDLTIVIAYLVAITSYGLYVGRKESRSQEGYFLGGRKFSWFAIGASVFATNISITQFMSGNGLAHQIGFAAINNDIIGALLLSISAVFFIPLYIRSRLYTMPEFMEKRFSSGTKFIFGGTYLAQMLLNMPTGFYIGGLAVLGLFGLDAEYLPTATILIGLTVGAYSVLGGLTSVVKTDVVQVCLLIGGGLAITIIGLSKVGGLGSLMAEFPEKFELIQPRGTAMPYTAFLGIAIHSAFFAFCSIHIIQRALGAKDVRNAKCGMLFSAYLKLLCIPLFALPGIIAYKLYGADATGDATYAMLISDLLWPGISGLVLAGLLAALMSSADSNVTAISSVVALDIWPALSHKKLNEKQALRVGKITAALLMLWGMLAAPYFSNLGPIYVFVLRLTGFVFMPIGVCFIFGRFSKRVNHQGAFATLSAGVVLGVIYVLGSGIPALQQYMPEWLLAWHFYEVLPFFFLICSGIMFGVSYLTPPPAPEKLAVLQQTRAALDETDENALPLFRRFAFWWWLFIAILGTLYIIF
ncbi:sodium/solute symporter [Pelagicoccus enzymogenes]|uniref:SLC5 family protein n=1 Tax=Pelagicoccus enzymogenes TaxID=2773457 RepID=UPI00280DAF47|nr:sodium/solute symporter [Pelagicoccus enzymogenes]MDQ8197992.1 sodium/solute symporter [Pelagicoccus enzymogenes]